MTFQWEAALWGLALVPLAILGYVLAQRRRVRYAVRFTNLDLLANVVERSPGWRRHLPAALYLVALSALLVSLARPEAVVQVPREQATVMLVVDVSGSMDATDVAPSRLRAAESAVRTFLGTLPPGIKTGLVAFSTAAQVITPPTADRAAIGRGLGTLRANGGTAMGEGLGRALDTLAPYAEAAPVAIVLLSDGANTLGTDPLEATTRAAALGIPIYTIALGTPGGTITVQSTARGPLQTIRVPPDPDTLRQIAERTNATFFSAPTDSDLQAIYRDLGSRIGFDLERQEITVLFAGLGLLLMLMGGAYSILAFDRLP